LAWQAPHALAVESFSCNCARSVTASPFDPMASILIVCKALEESIRQNTDSVGVEGLIVIGKPAYIPATDFAQSA